VIDWVALAKGFGVPACSVGTDNDITDALSRGVAERGPRLIEDVSSPPKFSSQGFEGE
jgi:acetolactate synthase-1/2/3 large subunit